MDSVIAVQQFGCARSHEILMNFSRDEDLEVMFMNNEYSKRKYCVTSS